MRSSALACQPIFGSAKFLRVMPFGPMTHDGDPLPVRLWGWVVGGLRVALCRRHCRVESRCNPRSGVSIFMQWMGVSSKASRKITVSELIGFLFKVTWYSIRWRGRYPCWMHSQHPCLGDVQEASRLHTVSSFHVRFRAE